MKTICKLILAAQLLSLPTYADDTDPFLASKGYTLTKDSWVFSPDKAKQVRDKLIDLETSQKQNESYKISLQLQQDMLDIQEKKVKLYSEQNDSLAKNLEAERTVNNWQRLLYVGLGAAAVVLGGMAIQRAGK